MAKAAGRTECIHAATLASALAFFGFTLAAAAQGLPLTKPESIGLSSVRLERVRQFAQGLVERGVVPGAVMLVARNGKVAFYAAVGEKDRERHVAMHQDSLFRIASMTKPVTSVAI